MSRFFDKIPNFKHRVPHMRSTRSTAIVQKSFLVLAKKASVCYNDAMKDFQAKGRNDNGIFTLRGYRILG